MKLLGISGSLQARSSNTALLDVARAVGGPDVEVVTFDRACRRSRVQSRYGSVARRGGGVPRVARARRRPADRHARVRAGLPGSLKNLLDWMVGTGDLYGKRVAIVTRRRPSSTASTRRSGAHLAAQGAVVDRVADDRRADHVARRRGRRRVDSATPCKRCWPRSIRPQAWDSTTPREMTSRCTPTLSG